jgi:hypothetical protein
MKRSLLDQELDFELSKKDADMKHLKRLIEAGAGGNSLFRLIDHAARTGNGKVLHELLGIGGKKGAAACVKLESFTLITGLRLSCNFMKLSVQTFGKQYGLEVVLKFIDQDGTIRFSYDANGKFSLMKFMVDICYAKIIWIEISGASAYKLNKYMLEKFLDALRSDLGVALIKFYRGKIRQPKKAKP